MASTIGRFSRLRVLRHPLIVGIVVISLVVTGAGLSAASAASTGQQALSKQFAAIAASPATSTVQGLLPGALFDPAIAQSAEELLNQAGSTLTRFQKDLLIAEIDIGPANGLLSSLATGTPLTSTQRYQLLNLRGTLSRNPAIQMLESVGHNLSSNPSTLASDVAALTGHTAGGYTAPTTGVSTYDAALAAPAALLNSPAYSTFAGLSNSLLSNPEAFRLIEELPPLALASFIPTQELLGLQVPTYQDSTSRPAAQLTAFSSSLNPVQSLVLKTVLASLFYAGGIILSPYVVGLAVVLELAGAAGALSIEALEAMEGISEVAKFASEVQDALSDYNSSLQTLLNSLVVSPSTAQIAAGASQTFTAEGYDAFGNDLGSFTGKVTWSISPMPNASCVANTCAATVPGVYTVTATDGAYSASAQLTVVPGPLNYLLLSPTPSSIAPGASQAYSIEGYDASGNDLGPVTSGVTLSISPDGSCDSTALTCTTVAAGEHIVTATDETATGTASLTVTGAPNCSVPQGGSLNLAGIDLQGCNLTSSSESDLFNDNLTGANLSGTNLTYVDLQDANLTDANLTDANLTGADLIYTNLTGATMTGATITGVSWAYTTCPDGRMLSNQGTCANDGA